MSHNLEFQCICIYKLFIFMNVNLWYVFLWGNALKSVEDTHKRKWMKWMQCYRIWIQILVKTHQFTETESFKMIVYNEINEDNDKNISLSTKRQQLSKFVAIILCGCDFSQYYLSSIDIFIFFSSFYIAVFFHLLTTFSAP